MSDLLTRLIEAGTPGHLVAEVARELARAEVEREAIEARRSADRERQARRRGNVTSRDTADVTDAAPFPAPPNENNLTPPTHTPVNNTPRAKADPFPRPDWCEPGLWADFLKCRKTKRLTNTATAHAGVLADLADLSARTGWPPGRVLAACVKKGWGAPYETDEMKEITGGKPKQRNGPASTIDAVQRAIELTGGATGCDPAGSGRGDQRIGQMPDPVRAIGYVER